MSDYEIDAPTATLYHVHVDAGWQWHDGPGWYYVDDEYPEDSGAVGSFPDEAAARAHAETAWSPPYRVTGDVVVVSDGRRP